MKKCIKCTLTYDDDDKFICENCGMPLQEVVENTDIVDENGIFQIIPDENDKKINSYLEKINGIKNKKTIALIAILIIGTLLSLFSSSIFIIVLIASLVYIVKKYNDNNYKKKLYFANIAVLGLCFGVGVVTFYLNNRKPYIGEFECAVYSMSEKRKVGDYNIDLKFDKKRFSIKTEGTTLEGDYDLTKKIKKKNNDEYRLKLVIDTRTVDGEKIKNEEDKDVYKFTFKQHRKKGEYLFINSNSYTAYICKEK